MNILSITDDAWRRAEGEAPAPADRLLLTPAQWRAVGAQWPADVSVGLLLGNDDNVQALGFALDAFTIIALQFPRWTDGRAYSQARLLRRRLRFAGELRAVGDVVVDMALPLARTGFDVAVLRGGESREAALRALRFFDGLLPSGNPFYQGDAHEPRPLFARGFQ